MFKLHYYWDAYKGTKILDKTRTMSLQIEGTSHGDAYKREEVLCVVRLLLSTVHFLELVYCEFFSHILRQCPFSTSLGLEDSQKYGLSNTETKDTIDVGPHDLHVHHSDEHLTEALAEGLLVLVLGLLDRIFNLLLLLYSLL